MTGTGLEGRSTGQFDGSDRWVFGLLLALGIGFVLLVFVAWRWGVPALAGVAADHVPPEWERRFGAAVMQSAAPEPARVGDPRVATPVREVFDRLVAVQASPRDSFQVIVLRQESPNAFAAPGGYVVVTTGLLRALRGADELAAVLAHEISHVAGRHTTRGLFARLGLGALVALIAGDQSALGHLVNAAGELGALSYSRGDESDADARAVRLLARAGIPPTTLVRALESISTGAKGQTEAALSFLSTHPSPAGRGERVRTLAAGVTVGPPAPLPDTAAWRAMRQALPEAPAR